MDDSRANELIDEFDFLDDWEERYRHVIELGKALEPLSENERNDASKVQGCVSQVWLVSEAVPGEPPLLHFRADSDAHIVRGLAALLIRLLSDRPAKDILALDAKAVFEAIGMADNLSAQRSNGLGAMITRMRAVAKAALTKP
ncbi:MAG: cysteine desulfuration protein SufE [Robiginitomaculum sp.]|nr:MAG: cysteine desulfuration protein SufE [Robiginitomaculum sp.]